MTMKPETAQMLLQSILSTAEMAAECQVRITALTNVLKGHNRSVFDGYEREVERLKQTATSPLGTEGIANLQSRLIQD
jgi:hypothetical protein